MGKRKKQLKKAYHDGIRAGSQGILKSQDPLTFKQWYKYIFKSEYYTPKDFEIKTD